MDTLRHIWSPCLSAIVLAACSSDSQGLSAADAESTAGGDASDDVVGDVAAVPPDVTVQDDAADSGDVGIDTASETPSDTSSPDDGGSGEDAPISPEDSGGIDIEALEDTLDVTPFVLDCDAYCTLMGAACAGPNVQYASPGACQTACATFSLGPPGDATGNSLTCRYGRALLAEQNVGDAGTLCIEAGPTGGDGCGAVCAGFCTIAQDLCVSTWVGLDCEGICSTFPAGSTDCRVGAALAGDCASTSVSPGGACEAPLPSGDQCGNALAVGSLPFTGMGDTTGATDDYHYVGGLCGGEFGGSGGKGAPDQVWVYVASSPETLRIELRAKGDYDSILYVTTGCDDVSAECLDKKDSVGFQPAEIIELDVTAGQTLYIVVDASGPSAAEVGSYELKVSSLQ